MSGCKIGKSLFLFATHGAAAGSAHALKAMDHAKASTPNEESSEPTAARAKWIPSFWRRQNQNLSQASGLPMRRQPWDILMSEIDMEDLKRLVSKISDKVIRS